MKSTLLSRLTVVMISNYSVLSNKMLFLLHQNFPSVSACKHLLKYTGRFYFDIIGETVNRLDEQFDDKSFIIKPEKVTLTADRSNPSSSLKDFGVIFISTQKNVDSKKQNQDRRASAVLSNGFWNHFTKFSRR